MFSFAHIPDVHLGCWNSQDLKEYPQMAFQRAIDICIEKEVDFILIAGDLFDTALPTIDVLKFAVSILKKCVQKNISVYIIPGSHDYSPTGKTMISVLEEAGLVKNVAKGHEENGKIVLDPTVDGTGAKIYGMMGRKGGLEKTYFSLLDHSIEKEDGFRIFLFHSGLQEYKPEILKEMECIPFSLLPQSFDYYAAGHIHHRMEDRERKIFYPGVLFPTEFTELEKYDSGFYIVENTGRIEWVPIKLFDTTQLNIKADNKTGQQIEKEIIEFIESKKIGGKLFLLKIKGIMSGKITDINFNIISEILKKSGSISVKKNINSLTTKDFEELKVSYSSPQELENTLIKESNMNMNGISNDETIILTKSMMQALNSEKQESETNYAYEERIKNNAKKLMGI